MSDSRAFEGVWIPAALWLDQSLSLQEKVMLVEIKSLSADNARGCFKSNKKFAEFFGLSVSRVSEVISKLKKKGFIRISEKRQGKQIIERNIFLSAAGLGVFGISKGYSENAKNPIRNPEGGYSENAKESSTSLSNTERERAVETPSEPPSRSKRGTRIPDDCPLTNEYVMEAKRVRPDLINQLPAIAETFRDYWLAESGQKAVKTDWLATWRNWLRREKKQGNRHENIQPGTGNKLQHFHDQINAAAARAASREDAAGPVEANDPAVRPQVVYAASADGRR